MSQYTDWRQQMPKKQKGLWLVACYVFVCYGAIDVGRAIYQFTY